MAFSGTELEEVAPTTVGTTCAGGGKVFAIGSGQTAIMDDATSEAYLYSSPGDNAWTTSGSYYATASSAYSSATSKAWYGTIGAFRSITAAGITGSVSSGTPGGGSGAPLLSVPLLSQHCDHRRLRVGRMGAVSDLIFLLLGQVDDLHL